jgi:hypothetical protein
MAGFPLGTLDRPKAGDVAEGDAAQVEVDVARLLVHAPHQGCGEERVRADVQLADKDDPRPLGDEGEFQPQGLLRW